MRKFFCTIILILMLSGCQYQKKSKNTAIANNNLEQAMIEIDEHDYKKALQSVCRSLAAQETPQALALKATLLYRLKEFNESLLTFEKLIKLNTVSEALRADSKNNYACVLNQLGQKEKAKQLWQELTKDINYLTPEVAHFNLGLIALGSGDFSEAEKKLLEAINMAPDYVDAYFYLSILYMQEKEYKKAREKLQTVLTFAPEHKAARDLLGQLNKTEKEGN